MRKKINSFLVVTFFLLFSYTNASAFLVLDDWQMDLTSLGGGISGPIERILFQGPGVGSTNIVQDLGGNAQIDLGDTFTETVWMVANQYIIDGVFGTNDLSLGGNNLLIAVDASGEVVDFVDQNNYGYTLSGSVSIYLDDDQEWDPFTGNAEFGAAPTLLASSTINTTGKVGTADGFLGAIDVLSNWGVTTAFDFMAADVFLDSDGDDVFVKYDGNVFASAQGVTNIDVSETVFGADSITFIGNTGDDFQLGVVPEPTTMILFGVGLLGLAGVSRRRFDA